MTRRQLVAALAGRGVDFGDDPDDALDEALGDGEGVITELADERWASLPALLTGRVFTHRVSGPEIEHDILAANPDLEPVTMLIECEEDYRLADGSPARFVLLPFDTDALSERGIPLDVVDGHDALLLPPGYLRGQGLIEGDTITLGLTGDGLVLQRAAKHDANPETLGQRLSAILEDSSGEPVPLDIVVWTACADDPALFTEPHPPLGTMLDAFGLSRDGEWLAGPGFDFPRWWAENRRAAIARRYDLSEDETLAVQVLVSLYGRIAELLRTVAESTEEVGAEAALATLTSKPEPAPAGESGEGTMAAVVRETLELLAEPAVAEAVLAETIGSGTEGAAALGLFAEGLEPQAPRAARPALLWLLGKAHERLAAITEAEAAYQAAESLDPQWSPVLVELARYASDRGDAARGLSLLRRAELSHDHELIEVLEHFQAKPRPGLGRNQPCWCGSGRKYKACHLRNEQRPLDERTSWLYQKAVMFVLDGPWRAVLMEAAQVRAEYAEDADALLRALTDPLIIDSVLFEAGAFAEFVAIRGMLLPEDERSLAEQWPLITRSVYEIERVRRGIGLTMRDVRTGKIHELQERKASLTLTAGELVCTRVLPGADTEKIFGGVEPVALHQREELIALLDSEPDPIELVAFLTRRFAPPDKDASDQLDPAVAATALEEFIRGYEQRWLDQPIPALAGSTPREAAADPTRRGDLARLLDSLPPHHDNPETMDPDRLRAALNLR